MGTPRVVWGIRIIGAPRITGVLSIIIISWPSGASGIANGCGGPPSASCASPRAPKDGASRRTTRASTENDPTPESVIAVSPAPSPRPPFHSSPAVGPAPGSRGIGPGGPTRARTAGLVRALQEKRGKKGWRWRSENALRKRRHIAVPNEWRQRRHSSCLITHR